MSRHLAAIASLAPSRGTPARAGADKAKKPLLV
jgi:hypothetical protein